MIRRDWIHGMAALVMLAGTCAAPGQAQDRKLMGLDFADQERFIAIRNGKPPGGDAEKAKNEEVVRKMAHVQVNRLVDAANTASGSGDNNAITDVVRKLDDSIVDPIKWTKINERQAEFIATFGKELTPELLKLIGTSAKPSSAEMLLKVNATRMLSILGRSGYEGVASGAAEILNDSKQSDAVKLYAIQAIKNVFAVPAPDHPEKSVISKPEQETAAILALVDFIARKPDLSPTASREEVDAIRYVRREAIRALGHVRKSIVRDPSNNAKVIVDPALWLLRVANSDRELVPSPSLSERVEGVIGYLMLIPDTEENMDFAAGFVATAMRDIAQEYKDRKLLEKPKADDKSPPAHIPEERDYLPWKLVANRLSLAFREWRYNWETYVPVAKRSAQWQEMVRTVATAADEDILRYMMVGNQTESVDTNRLRIFLQSMTNVPNLLFNEDKNSFITRPDAR
jgi:hypothetical protein